MLSFEFSMPPDPENWERLKAAVEVENTQRLRGLSDTETSRANSQAAEPELPETYKSHIPDSMRRKLTKRQLATLPPLPGSQSFEQFIGLHECSYILRYGEDGAARERQ